MKSTSLTADQHELIEQARGGVPSPEVWTEVQRVVSTFNTDDEAVTVELSVRPASAESAYSMLNVGEMVFEIVTESVDTDGNDHDAVTFIGQSGKIYGITADGIES